MTPRQYYLYRQGRQIGAFSAIDLRRLSQAGQLRPDDFLSTPGLPCEVPVRDVLESFSTTQSALLSRSARSREGEALGEGRVALPPGPAVLPARGAALLSAGAVATTTRHVARWVLRQAMATGRAMLLQAVRSAEYSIWRVRSAGRQPPPAPTCRATRLCAALGGTILAVFVGLMFTASGHAPEALEVKSAGLVLNKGPSGNVTSLAEHTTDQSSARTPDSSADAAEADRRDVGMRIPVRAPTPELPYWQRQWSKPRRRYGPTTPFSPGAAAQEQYTRQQALAEAQHQAERALRNYGQQTAGQFGAMGLTWGPGGGNAGYGISYGPSPSASLPPVRPNGNMPSASAPGASPWGR